MAYDADTSSWHSSDDDDDPAAYWLAPSGAAGSSSSSLRRGAAAPPLPLLKQTSSQRHSPPRMLVLVGLTGAGKSTLAGRLIEAARAAGGRTWTRVSQDQLGKRTKCEALASSELAKGNNVVIDRTNLTVDQRAIWLGIAAEYGATCEAVALQTHPDECRRRAVRRTVHEGDVAGPDAARVVNSQIALDDRCPPTPAEGFHRVHSVDTSKDMNSVVKSLLHNSLTPQPYQHAEGQIFLEPWQQSQPSDSTGQSSGPAVRPPVPLSILTAPKLQAPAYYLSPTQSSKKKSAEQSKTNQPRLLSFGHTVETQDGSQDGGTGRRKGFGRPTGNGSEAASAAAWRCDVCNQFNSGGAVTCSLCLCPRNAPAAASAATAATSSSSSVRPGAAAPPGRPAIPPPPPAASPPVVDDEVLFGSWNEQPDAVRDDPPLAGSWSTLPKAGAAGAGKNAATKAPAPATRDRMPSDDMDSDRIEYLRTATQRPTPTKGNPRIQRVDTTLLRGDATVAADDTFVPPASSTAAPPPNADWLWQWDSEQVCPLCVQPWKSLRIGMGRSALAAQQAHIKACAGMRR